jgi:sn1-specific diacylglycerol lipase
MEQDTMIERTLYSNWPFLFGRQHWWWLSAAALLISQIAEILVSWVFLGQLFSLPIHIDTTMDLSQSQFAVEDDDVDEQGEISYNHELVEEMWAERCAKSCQFLSRMTCYMFGGQHVNSTSEFGDVARALADYLETRGVLNVVPSDIVVGLVVLQRLQRQRVYAARMEFIQDMERGNASEESNRIEDEGSAVSLSRRKVSSSEIRRRASSQCLEEQQQTTSRSKTEDLLLSSEWNSKKQSIDTISKRIQNSKHHRTLYRRIVRDGSYQQEERALMNRSEFSELHMLEEAARYSRYALAIYTWVLYLYVHPVAGPARLVMKSGCACAFRNNRSRAQSIATNLVPFVDVNGRIEGDNLCETHKSAILLTAGLEESDIIYVQLKSSFTDNPYCILLDHKWKSVVVSIRGTFSLEDCITDVLLEPESLEQLGEDFCFDAQNQYCHGGVLTCVRNVYRDLERHGLLDELLLGDDARVPDYTLRLVGHSLGAATCTLLSYMLRTKFPSLRCVTYSPPGGTLTWEMATGCKEWCTSCVLDSDLVPRLSLAAMERLRDEVLDLIGRIRVNKIEVARHFVHSSALWGLRLCNEQELEDQEALVRSMKEVLYEPGEVPASEYQQQLERFNNIQAERRRRRGKRRDVQLFPPGRILHLAKTGEKRSCIAGLAKLVTCCTTNIGSQYVPIWVENDDLNEIIVSPTMGTDHFPNRMRSILEMVAGEFGLQTP